MVLVNYIFFKGEGYQATMKSITFLSFLLLVLQTHCQNPRRDKSEGQGIKTIDYSKIVPGNAEFAFRCYRKIASVTAGKNIVVSPLSISMAFAMLSLGAESDTQTQIHEGLAFNLSDITVKEIHDGFRSIIHMLNRPDNETEVNVGNALFIDDSWKILPQFLKDVKTFYEAECLSSNFGDPITAKNQINDYVDDKTHGKITQAIDNLDPSTVIVLINYIWLKASWKDPFDPESTKEEDFFVDASTTVKVNMMYQVHPHKYLQDEELSCWVVAKPYKGNMTSLFIVPDEGKMQQVENGLGKERLTKWITSFRYDYIQLYIPKCFFSTTIDVKDLMQRLGVTLVFSDNADLSGISGQRDLKVSHAVQKAVVDLHENGTEAAAVTILGIVTTSLIIPPPLIIKMNRPFLCLIIDSITKSILYFLKVINPTEI